MYLKCLCGNILSDAASPNGIEHLLLSDYAREKLENLVDKELEDNGSIDLWPEHWEDSGATEVWRCPKCKRLYFHAMDDRNKILIYKIEQEGLSNS